MAAPVEPLVRFGVITDIQYADVDDGKSFHGKPRFYRLALEKAKGAVKAWNESESKLNFAINLGDIVDGRSLEKSEEKIEMLVSELEKLEDAKVYHALGNHALYNLDRDKVHKLLRFPEKVAYYDFKPCKGLRFVVLDSFDVSLLGTTRGTPEHTAAASMLAEARARLSKFEDPHLNSPDAMDGTNRRWCAFNGAIGSSQLGWLRGVLEESKAAAEKVVICCHVPLHPNCTTFHALEWNYADVLDVIHKYSDQVVACLYGHEHDGGYCVDEKGIHHRTFEAVLESPETSTAYAVVEVYGDKIVINGKGSIAVQELAIPGKPGPALAPPPAPPLKRSVSQEAKEDMVVRGEGAISPPSPREGGDSPKEKESGGGGGGDGADGADGADGTDGAEKK